MRTINITIINENIIEYSPDNFLGFSNEHNETTLVITIPASMSTPQYVRLIFEGNESATGVSTAPIFVSNGKYTYLVPQGVMQLGTEVKWQLAGYQASGEEIINIAKCKTAVFYVKPSLEYSNEMPADMEAPLDTAIAQAATATTAANTAANRVDASVATLSEVESTTIAAKDIAVAAQAASLTNSQNAQSAANTATDAANDAITAKNTTEAMVSSPPFINDTISSATTVYSSNKVMELMAIVGDGGAGLLPHTHAVSDVENLQSILDGKAASTHSHVIGDLPAYPTELKNPNALTFTGSATGTYDGSAAVTINIPIGTGEGVGLDDTTASTITTYSSSKIESELTEKAAASHTHLAADLPAYPTALPNPNALTLTGGATGTYDGSSAVSVSIPAAYVHPTTAGNKHIPTGGADGQYLKWSASGTAVWATGVGNDENFISCKALTLVPDSTTEAANNFTKLKTAIEGGSSSIFVDGLYYIANGTAANAIQITSNLKLAGVTPDAEFKFTALAYFFQLTTSVSQILVDSVRFTATHDGHSGQAPRIFNSGATNVWFINEFTIQNCTFNGGFNVMRCTPPTTTDPAVTPFGFQYVNILNNNFNDIGCGFPAFSINDYAHELITVCNNRVSNMDYCFLYAAIVNEGTYYNNISVRKRNMLFTNNYFFNEDTFWIPSITDDYCAATCYEGYECEYSNNHVEGLKTIYASVLLYDAYISAVHVINRNNVFKNIFIAASTAPSTPTCLMKAKGYSTAFDVTGGTRLYDGNQYIIDETYVTTVCTAKGTTTANIYCNLYQTVEPSLSFVVRNCYVNVWWLHIIEHNGMVKNCIFENNYITAKYLTGYIFGCSITTTTYVNNIVYKGNTFIGREKHTTGVAGGTLTQSNIIYLLQEVDNVVINKIEFLDNHIELYHMFQGFRCSVKTTTITEFNFSRNTIVFLDAVTSLSTVMHLMGQENMCHAKIMYADGNLFDVRNSTSPYKATNISSMPVLCPNYTIRVKSNFIQPFIIGITGDIQADRYYYTTVRITLVTDTAIEDYYLKYRVSYSPSNGRNVIDLTSAAGTATTALLVKSSDTNYTDADGLLVKLNALSGTVINGNTSCVFRNTQDWYSGKLRLTVGGSTNTKMYDLTLDVKTAVGGPTA